MGKKIRGFKTRVMVAVMVLLLAFPGNVWGGWEMMESGWYHVDEEGTPDTGWIYDNGFWYFCSPLSAGRKGQMLTGWQWIDGKCYYFTQEADRLTSGKPSGAMYAGEITPDGFSVSLTGAWTDESGVEQYVPGKGILTAVTTIKKSSFGGGGNGGGSGGGGGGGGAGGTRPQAQERPEEPEIPGGAETPDQPERPVEPEKPSEPESPSQVMFNYRIRYMDIENSETLREIIGTNEKDWIIRLDHPDLIGYEICGNQPDQLVLSQDNLTEHIYYRAIRTATPGDATPSDAEMVNWEIRFTDAETHGVKLGETRSGTIKDGGTLTVRYMDKITIDKTRWKAQEPSPLELEVYGPGNWIHYVEYEKDGILPEEEESQKEEKARLEAWLNTAKNYEKQITGEKPERIPDGRFIVSNQPENNLRIRSLIHHMDDAETYTFFIIGKNVLPNGVEITEWFGDEAEYSNSTEETIKIGEDTYTVARMTITRKYDSSTCIHTWESTGGRPAGCLGKGSEHYACTKCGAEAETVIPAPGHTDQDNDSICDRCGKRAIDQTIGSELEAELSIEGGQNRTLTFTCIDADYQGGMLYISNEDIPLSDFGGYGSLNYNESNVRQYFQSGFQNTFSINGENLLPINRADSPEADYAMILSREEVIQYQALIPGGTAYLTRTPDGNGLAAVKEDGSFTVIQPESGICGVRPAVVLAKPEAGEAELNHWNIGDLQARELAGKTYLFECIDQNYVDTSDNHKQTALFLCTTIIPANTGSFYRYEEQADGTSKYVLHPGPIVNFGTGSDYKYSKVRKWLKTLESDLYNVGAAHIGVSYSYTGKTEEGTYSQLNAEDLSPHYIGSQKMTDKLFILSVDEAIKYKDYLWRFHGAEEENPDTQYGAYSKGYWLRNPMGTDSGETGYAYIVDIVNGNIRPQEVRPAGDTGNEELDVTGTTGIRPAYTMPQD